MSLQQSNVYLVSALCIGGLISIIRAAPIVSSLADPVPFKPTMSLNGQTIATTRPPPWHISPETMANDDWIPTGSTFYSNSATRVPVRTAFAAYITSNLTQIVHPNTLRVWPSHADRVKVEPLLSSILQGYGPEITTPLGTIHSSHRAKPRKRRKSTLPRSPSSSAAELVHRLEDSSSVSGPASESKTNIEEEHSEQHKKRRGNKRSKDRVTAALGSFHPRVGARDPEIPKFNVTSAIRNPELVLLGHRPTLKSQKPRTPPSGSGSKSDMNIEEKDKDKDEARGRKSTVRLRGRKKHLRRKHFRYGGRRRAMRLHGRRNLHRKKIGMGNKKIRKMSVPIELTIPMKYLARAGDDEDDYEDEGDGSDEDEGDDDDDEGDDDDEEEGDDDDEDKVITKVELGHENSPDEFLYTEAPVWKDTRYHFLDQSRKPRMRIDSNPIVEYYPDNDKLERVCRTKSTILNTDIVMGYINPHIYQKHYAKRKLYLEFRDEYDSMPKIVLYCHHPTIIQVVRYLDCAIMRHKMMESMIPKYPYHQVQPALV